MAYYSDKCKEIGEAIELYDFKLVSEKLDELGGYDGTVFTSDIRRAANAIRRYNSNVEDIKSWVLGNHNNIADNLISDIDMDELRGYLENAESECNYFEEIIIRLSKEGKFEE